MDFLYQNLLYISGAATMGYMLAGVYFLRFWARTRDGFFLSFAAAFWLMAANQAAVAFAEGDGDEVAWIYMLRLCAFILIILAIVGKNLRARG
ncbi:MAG TPA: DUF5985 family protein [Azospirillaceae bacterium]|nr:DUF5985 family protein [Azospirillaceae bacterium]